MRLVLIGFALAILPVLVLIGQASHAIYLQTQQADHSAREAVMATRRAQTLLHLTNQLERTARQYMVLGQPQLLDFYHTRLAHFIELFQTQSDLLNSAHLTQPITQKIQLLQQFAQGNDISDRLLLDQFAQLTEQIEKVKLATHLKVDAQLDAMQLHAGEVYSQLWLECITLLLLTLIAIIFFTWRIISPIRQLEQRIFSLGQQPRPKFKAIKGPAELVALGERLNWLAQRLNELEAQERMLLRHLSHELKTPLAAIREGSALLLDVYANQLQEGPLAVIHHIDNAGAELQALIEQLLDYNALLQGYQPNISRFDVVTLIHNVIDRYRFALEAKGVKIHAPSQPLYWQADRVRTRRIIDNLISNVIAYGAEKGQLWIRVWQQAATAETKTFLIIEIANSGEPIAPADRPYLFEPFYKGQRSRYGALKGSGIGLAVAAESAAIQGGTLRLVEDAAEDVCFRLTLPELPI